MADLAAWILSAGMGGIEMPIKWRMDINRTNSRGYVWTGTCRSESTEGQGQAEVTEELADVQGNSRDGERGRTSVFKSTDDIQSYKGR